MPLLPFYRRLNQRLIAANGSFVTSRRVLKSITCPRHRFSPSGELPPPGLRKRSIGTRKSTAASRTITPARPGEKALTKIARIARANAAIMYCPAPMFFRLDPKAGRLLRRDMLLRLGRFGLMPPPELPMFLGASDLLFSLRPVSWSYLARISSISFS